MPLCEIKDLLPSVRQLTEIRHAIHRQPELAFEEQNTSAVVADLLRTWGYEVATGVGRTGVVGTLRAGDGDGDGAGARRSMAIRADMDGLPMQELTGLPYASTVAGKMHACGHDGHTAMLLAAAQYLARTRNFRGTLHLYFQPAEEKGFDSGAQAMIADGLFERFPCDAVFGMHNHPGQAQGRFLLREGAYMAAADKLVITVRGKAGHAARPHLAVDATVAAASIVMALQTVVSRNVDPAEPAVVTVGVLRSGVANNVVSDEAVLELSIRSFSATVQAQMRERITAIAELQARSHGATAEVVCHPGYPVLVNTPAETALAVEVARELVGDDAVDPHFGLVTASEDFAYMLQQRPGCFLRIGNGVLGPSSFPVHHPRYDFDDRNLPVGGAFWARLVERYLPV